MAKKEVSALIAAIDPYVAALLGRISEGKRVISIQKGKRIFSQGDRADAIYFVQSGTVKVSVLSSAGKEAVLAILGPRQFFGEGALVSANRFESARPRRSNGRHCFRSKGEPCFVLFMIKLSFPKSSWAFCWPATSISKKIFAISF